MPLRGSLDELATGIDTARPVRFDRVDIVDLHAGAAIRHSCLEADERDAMVMNGGDIHRVAMKCG
jgi:hypothetical protein